LDRVRATHNEEDYLRDMEMLTQYNFDISQNIVKEIKQYQEKWLQHMQRMDTNRIPKQALQYKPKGRRNIRTTEKEMEGTISF
jgi:hypothetical protein